MKLRNIVTAVLCTIAFSVSNAQEELSLEEVIDHVLEKNYDVRVARNVARSVEMNSNYAPAAFFPQVSATGATVWNTNEQELRFQDATRNSSGQTESNNTTVSLLLGWTLFDGTRMFATRERLAELAEQGELVVKDQMVNTIATVIANYFDIVRAKQQLLAIQEQMAVNEERVKLAERKLQVGTGIKPELLQAQVDLNAQRTEKARQETLILQLKQQLNALAGLSLPSVFEVADTIIIDLDLENDETFRNLENSNYQLMAARRNLNIASLAIQEQKAAYFPQIDFNAAYNFSRNDNTRLINPFAPAFSQTAGLNYGFTVTVPIFMGLNTRRLTQQARLEFNRQSLLYEQQRNDASVALTNAFLNYENAKKILMIEEETIGAAKENVSIALQTFKAGVTTAVELRQAQQSLADAYNRLISARYNAKLAETELLRLNGSLLR